MFGDSIKKNNQQGILLDLLLAGGKTVYEFPYFLTNNFDFNTNVSQCIATVQEFIKELKLEIRLAKSFLFFLSRS